MSNTLQGIVYLTPEQYETLVNDGHITANGKTIAYNKNTLYITKAASSDGATSNVDLSGYYTKKEVDNLIANIEPSESMDLTNYYTKEETDNLITSIEAFDGDYNSLTNKPTIPTKTSELTNDSNFVAQSAMQTALDSKLDMVTMGDWEYPVIDEDGKKVIQLPDLVTSEQFTEAIDACAKTADLTTTLNSAKSYTDTQIADLIDSAPETRNTLKELSDAIKENEDVASALTAAIGNKANQSDLDTTNSNIQELSTTVQSNKTAVDTFNEIYNGSGRLRVDTIYAKDICYETDGNVTVTPIDFKIYNDVVQELPNVVYSKEFIDAKITGNLPAQENLLTNNIELYTVEEHEAGNEDVTGVVGDDGNHIILDIKSGSEYTIEYIYGGVSGSVTATFSTFQSIIFAPEVVIPGLKSYDGTDTTLMIAKDMSMVGYPAGTTFTVNDPTGIDMMSRPAEHLTITKMYLSTSASSMGALVKDVDNLVNYYKKSEIDSKIPTAVSQLTNDAGFITDYTETDPTVPSHVKAITEANITSWNNKVESSTLNNYSLTTHNHDTAYSKLNHSHAYGEITGTPTLSTVATSGNYNDLLNKPTIPDTSNFITKSVNNLTNYYTKTSVDNLLSNKLNSGYYADSVEINYIFTGDILDYEGV